MLDRLPRPLQQLLSPLALASYAAWAAVWLGSVGMLAARGAALGWAARIALLVFLAAWLRVLACAPRQLRWHDDVVLLALAGSAFALIALGPTGTAPILLVLLACVLAERFDTRGLTLALLTVNLLLLVLLRWRWQVSWTYALTSVVAYGAFQVFAALVLRYANHAEAMAEQLREVNARLLATRSLLDESARDAERLRLSRELHDVAGHKLTALKLNLRALARDPALAGRRELAVAAGLADELLADLRGVVRQLRQHDGLELGEALRRLAAPLPRPQVAIEVAADARAADAEQAETLLRIAQEGLTNAARHGGARRAWLRLAREGDALALHLDDDGRVRWPLVPGHGLTGMRERVERLGGTLELTPSRHGGLRLAARLPAGAGA
ncbi:MAG: sensor histidine kinase [Rehaibacterium terrae]|uniref:sensor histidine kinase n=1 Tax=Rehaibacterium terrae TaxID=1341696 RepID=UPI00391C8A8F